MSEPLWRIVVGARSKREGLLPPQVEPINLYALNPPRPGVGAVLLDSGFYVPPRFQQSKALFPMNYEKLRANALAELREGLTAHGYESLDVIIFSHGHIDHMGLAFEFQKEFGCEFWTSRAEQELRLGPANEEIDMREIMRQHGFYDGRFAQFEHLMSQMRESEESAGGWSGEALPIRPSRILEDEEILEWDDERYRVCLVQGHSPGQALLVNESRKGEFAIHGADQIQRNEPPTFLRAAGEGIGLGAYLASMDRLFERHREYGDIERIYPAHARRGRLERFESQPIGTLGQWWELCRAQIVTEIEQVLVVLARGPARALDIFEQVFAEKIEAFRRMGLPGLFAEMFSFMRTLGRLDLLGTEGWKGKRVRAVLLKSEGGPRFVYEVS